MRLLRARNNTRPCMARYSFTIIHQMENKSRHQCIIVEFDYWLPEQHEQWHDPERGSLQLVHLLDAFTHQPLFAPDIIDLIHLRRHSWAFLERRQLLFKQM